MNNLLKSIFFLICFFQKVFCSISVVIPCHSNHFIYIENLLSELSNQSLIPNQVVVSVSSANSQTKKGINELIANNSYPFELRILISEEEILAGPNRNKGCRFAKGEIIIFQDADDLPHPQRCEIINEIFMTENTSIVLHDWIDTKIDFTKDLFDVKSVKRIKFEDFKFFSNHKVQFGCPSIKKNVLTTNRWPNVYPGEDQVFLRSVLKVFEYGIYLPYPLIKYRQEFSCGG